MNVKEYAAQVAKDAGLQDDAAKAFIDSFGNEKLAKAFEDRMLAQSDYSRNMDGLRKKEADMLKNYQDNLAITAKNQEVVNEYDAQVKRYKDIYGELDGTGAKPSVDTSNFIDKKTFEEALNRQGQQSIQITKIATRCATDYYARFQKVLDIDALEKFTLESGLPLQSAYDKFIEPQVKEIENTLFADKLKKAREEGVTEGLSKRDNPTDTGSPAPNGFMGNLLKKTDGAPNPRNSFVEAWNASSK